MSAAALVLPLVWASVPAEPSAETHAEPSHGFNACRKGPHALRLIQPTPRPQPQPILQPSLQPRLQPSLEPLASTGAAPASVASPVPSTLPSAPPELAFYRKFTETLLQRYLRMSFEAGRVPSLMGRELFRGDASHTRVSGFDDVIHFVADVERCLARLSPIQQILIRRIAMYGYTQGETSAMTGISLRSVIRRYYEGLDRLTGFLVDAKLLQPNLGREGGC